MESDYFFSSRVHPSQKKNMGESRGGMKRKERTSDETKLLPHDYWHLKHIY
jgi:hypothetical protein